MFKLYFNFMEYGPCPGSTGLWAKIRILPENLGSKKPKDAMKNPYVTLFSRCLGILAIIRQTGAKGSLHLRGFGCHLESLGLSCQKSARVRLHFWWFNFHVATMGLNCQPAPNLGFTVSSFV